jgi:hypothetical protein
MNLVPATIGTIALAWFASQGNPRLADSATWPRAAQRNVEYRRASLGTHGDLTTTFSQISLVGPETASLMNFYTELMAEQQDLGKEFEKVLYDNLWDLYAR